MLEVSGVKLFAVRCPLGLRDGMGWDGMIMGMRAQQWSAPGTGTGGTTGAVGWDRA